MKDATGEHVHPRDLLLLAMQRYAEGESAAQLEAEPFDKTCIRRKAFILRVTLPIGETSVERVVAVPYHCTFRDLHRMIQRCYNWQNYHLYEFTVLDEHDVVVAQVSVDEENYANDPLEKPTKRLSAHLPRNKRLFYTYDFGDSWEHFIELERFEEAYTEKLPRCLSGVGTAPPEDVGGEGGYLEFLDIVNGPPCQERSKMLAWAGSQNWKSFDLEEVNRWMLI